MEWLSKTIDLLKAGGWQLIMIAAAAAVFLFLDRQSTLPGVNDTWRLSAWAAMLVCGFLAAAPVLGHLQRKTQSWTERRDKARARDAAMNAVKNRFRSYIPYMNEKERAIFGYLLKNKMKHFTADMDAGYGAGLMAMGFIARIGVPGQMFDDDKAPMGVPDPIWAVMEENPQQFAYEPEYVEGYDDVEVEPWRIPWQLR